MKIPYFLGRSYFSLKNIVILSVLIGLFIATQLIVKTFKNPNRMGVIESQAMDMTIETPTGVIPVNLEVVQLQSFASAVTYTGSVVAYNEMGVYQRIPGYIVSLPVYPGDGVKKGQLLAKLDTSELNARLDASRFAHITATKQFDAAVKLREKALADTKSLEEAVKAAKADFEYWQEEIKRSRKLLKEDVITQEEAQKEEAAFASSQSKYNQTIADFEASINSKAAAEYQTYAQKAQVGEARANLNVQQAIKSYASIISPYNAVVTERLISLGTFVEPGVQIMKIAQIEPVRIQVRIAQSDLQFVKPGNPVTIWRNNNRQGNPVHAKITSVFPYTDTKTLTTTVEAIFENKNREFLPGDFVTADIQTGTVQDSITVPYDALVDFEGQKSVWVVKNGKAYLRFVTTGDTDGKRIVVTKGLNIKDVIITRNVVNLQEGDRVVSAKFGVDGIDVLPQPDIENRLSETNNYKIRQSLKNYSVSSTLSQRPPVVGSNELTVTIASSKSMTPEDLDVFVSYLMPAMPKMAVAKPRIKKIDKNRFKITLMFSMPGLWQMNLTFKDGNKTVAMTVIETEVPE